MRFGVLGPIEVRADGRLLDLRASRLRQLLAVLLSRAGRPVPIASVVDALWPDETPENAVKIQRIIDQAELRKAG